MVHPKLTERAGPTPEAGSARLWEGAMAVPCALVAGCEAGFPGEELVKRIIGKEELPENVSTDIGARLYPWTIDNKYYSAPIHFCVVENRFLVTAEIAEAVQAFLAYFDSTTISGLDSISSWLPLVEEWLPEVMILVCDRVSENGVSRQKAQEWCIRHGFELVELNPEELPDEDDDFPESTGVKRIIQALNANVWSNVEMKSDLNQGFGFLPALAGANRRLRSEGNESPEPHPLPAESVDSAVDRGEDAAETEGEQRGLVAADPVLDMDIQELANLTAGEGDLENFERLFSKLKEMKEKAATLPHEQRKLHAEKVAKAFWMAIGGDRDEIEGLSSDEDN
ncbi:alpha- and gamma-adaptin-binding protein p34 [Anolis carolinensis]|uniref:Alpha and gamma adaptin binding protein n=1 Tax=Anolis carolinensis TaxID=28377 RepID=H9GFX5_ANOCA|nr:PREDICTED: alpha- and gamma-adaptin-binding protein p34 [Anolis carolinensis]|eukprot:XP_016852810.1 PREDICTED: alpha- and gamma-adaptin-binding protein p34 [Anolis carolinensis]